MQSFQAAVARMPWYGWVALGAVLFTQGTWLFLDARRRGENAWFWGLVGLIQCPCPSLLYWWYVIRPARERAE